MPSKELKPFKKIANELSVEDTAAVLDMTCAILKNLGGRPAVYPNTETGLSTFIENSKGYFAYVQSVNANLEEKAQIIPDIEGYCLWLGITRETLRKYTNRNNEWAEIIQLYKDGIACIKKELALRGKIPPMLAIFDLVNNHQYYNTNSFIIEHKAAADKENKADDLEESIRAAGLVWNPMTREYEPEGK